MRYSLPTFRNATAVAMSVLVVAASMPDFAYAAKRLGGGSSLGRQQSGITQRKAEPVQRNNTNAAPAQQAAPGGTATGTPASPAAAPGAAGAPAGAAASPATAAAQKPAASPASAAPAQQPARNRWLGPLAGLAAGIGLAALFSHLGLGDELASFISSFLMIALIVMAGVFLFRMFTRRRAADATPAYAGAGAGAGYGQGAAGAQTAYRQSAPADSVEAAPLQRQATGFGGQATSAAPLGTELNAYGQPIASMGGASGFEAATAEPPLVDTPAGFDIPGFERTAKQVFIRLQAANDAGDINTLREFASDDLLQAFRQEIESRGGAVDPTEVIGLEAQLIAYERDIDEHVASVVFTGQIRERVSGPAEQFEEIWNLARPTRQGGGWVLVGIQAV